MTFSVWVALASLAEFGRRSVAASVLGETVEEGAALERMSEIHSSARAFLLVFTVVALVLPMAAASFVGPYVASKFGRPLAPNDGVLVGLIVGAVAIVMAWVASDVSVGALAVFAVVIPMAWWGGRFGAARKA